MTCTRLCILTLTAILLSSCKEASCGELRVENLETGRCDCRAEYVEVAMECVPRGEVDAGPDANVDAPELDTGSGDGCTERTLYRDRDRDGRGDPDDSIMGCSDPLYVDNADDCDDACNTCWTGAEETCDTVDNDCDGFSDEGVVVPVGDPVMITTGEGARAQLTTTSVYAAELSDGSYLLFYEGSAGGFVTRTFDPRTDEIGEELVVDDSAAPISLSPYMSMVGDVIAFIGHASSGGQAWIRGRVYNRDGAPLGPAREVLEISDWDSGTHNYTIPYQVLVAAGSGYQLIWKDENGDAFHLPLQNNLDAPFGGIAPRRIWDDSDGQLEWLSGVTGEEPYALAAFRDGTEAGVSIASVAASTIEWVHLDPTNYSALDGRWIGDTFELVGNAFRTPGLPDDGFVVRLSEFDVADGTATRRSTRDIDDSAALFMPPVFDQLGAVTRIYSHRFSPTDRVGTAFRMDGPPIVVSSTSNPATPHPLGHHGVVYLEAGSDVAPSDVAFRRFGCPD